jgi:CheY-like chemotaxis protein
MTPVTGAPLILVAEDDPDLRALVDVILANAGYPIAAVGSGTELLRRAAEHLPRLVILDVRMPGLSGLEVCRLLREDPRTASCAVLMVSSHAAADDYLAKPFTPRQLLDRVTRMLEPVRSA